MIPKILRVIERCRHAPPRSSSCSNSPAEGHAKLRANSLSSGPTFERVDHLGLNPKMLRQASGWSNTRPMAVADCAAIILAAGQGSRFGPGRPKQLLPLAGKPLLQWSIEAFLQVPRIGEIVIVSSATARAEIEALLAELAGPIRLCLGGAERVDSLERGLAALSAALPLVVVHDGARPLVQPALIAQTIATAAAEGAAIAAIAATDTIKQATASGRISQTLDRATIYLAQTPQAFQHPRLVSAIDHWRRAGRPETTDDAQLLERAGLPVALVAGDPNNIKITEAGDLLRASRLLRGPQASPPAAGAGARIGVGYDVHRLVPGRALILGGVTIGFERGLAGHSDADVLTHAIADALLGAAALGDLGHHFPPSDPALRNIASEKLLAHVVLMVHAAGLEVVHLDSVVICQRPRLAPHLPEMRRRLAALLAVPIERVSVKATTTEGLGFSGREEGIAAQASCLLGYAP